ncbi:MAG: hypothetical protein FWG87_03600 [Defluviitaleaceae bacterium]|nr:hypothetical protein [Defluviitaleaceae bacterium]
MCKSNTDLADSRGFYLVRFFIRIIRVNPLNPNSLFVGDGFIRPEVRTFVNSGRATSIKAERGNLGTDKSVPYK